MEQADAGVDESDAVLPAGRMDVVGADRSAWFGDVPDPVVVGMVDVVAEGDCAV